MANFSPSKKTADDFNKGVKYVDYDEKAGVNGDGLQADTINNLVESALYTQEQADKSQEVSQQAKESASRAEKTAESAYYYSNEAIGTASAAQDMAEHIRSAIEDNYYFSDVSFANSDWIRIMNVIGAGKASTVFTYEDTRTISYGNGQQCTLVFLDLSGRHDVINYSYDSESNGNGFAPVTLGLLSTLDAYPYGRANSFGENEWEFSEIRTETMRLLEEMLPEEIRDYIVPVIKMTQKGGGDTSIIRTVERCFPLSLVEITGKCKTRIVQDGEIEDEAFVEEPFTLEGEQYDFFKACKDGEHGLGRIVDDYYYMPYWTRSPNGPMNAIYIDSNYNGKICSGELQDNNAIMFGFCVAGDKPW